MCDRDLLSTFFCGRGYLYFLRFHSGHCYFDLESLTFLFSYWIGKRFSALLNLFFNDLWCLSSNHLWLVQESREFSSHYERSTTKSFLYARIANFKQPWHLNVTFMELFDRLIFSQYFGMFNFIFWISFIYIQLISNINIILFVKITKFCIFPLPILLKRNRQF